MLRTSREKTKSCLRHLIILGAICNPLISYADGLAQAQDTFSKGEYSTAIIELKNLLQEEPNNTAGRALLGRAYIKEFNVLSAVKELEKARQLGAPPSDWLLPLSRAYLLSGQADKSLLALDELDKLNPANQAELLAIIGHAYLSQNQIIDAKESFNRALSSHQNAYAKVGLARVALFEQQPDQALVLLQEVQALEPNNLDALLLQSRVLASQNNFEAAILPLDKALQLENRLLSARLMRAELYIRTGQLSEARAEAEQLIGLNPNYAQAHLLLARLQFDAKEYQAAQTSGELVLRSMPNQPMALFILGAVHYNQRNFEQSQLYLENLLSLRPSHILGARLLGAAYLQLGDSIRAIELLRSFVENYSPNDALLLNLLGKAYLQSGEHKQGTAILNRALELNPDLRNTRTQLAMGQLASGDIDAAIVQLENAVEQPDATQRTSIMLILSYIRLQEMNKAFAAIDKANQQYPQSGIFFNLKGLAHEAQQKTKAARQAYQDALSVDSNFIPALLATAKLDFRAGDIEAARSSLNKALKINPDHQQTLLLMAKSAELEGDSAGLLRWLRKAKQSNPESVVPVNFLVNYYLQTNLPDKALSEASSYYSLKRKSISALSLMARVTSARGEYDKARSFLWEVIERNPKDIKHRMQLAQIESAQRDFTQALQSLDEVLAINSYYPPAMIAKTAILIAQNKPVEAARLISQFAEQYPDSYMNQRLQGDLLVAKKDFDSATRAYSKAFSKTKTQYLAQKLSGLLVHVNDNRGAAKVLVEYLSVFPNDHINRITLASIYQRLNNNQQAIAEFEKVTASTNDNVIVLNNLAWLYWLENDSRALKVAKQAVQLAPKSGEVKDTYGWIMLHQGNKKKALNMLHSAVSLNPENPDIRYHLSKALLENGDREQARKELIRLLRDYSGFEEESAARTLAASLM